MAGDFSDIPLSADTAWYFFKNAGCAVAALPAQILLLAWLWAKAQVREGPGGWLVGGGRLHAHGPALKHTTALQLHDTATPHLLPASHHFHRPHTSLPPPARRPPQRSRRCSCCWR